MIFCSCLLVLLFIPSIGLIYKMEFKESCDKNNNVTELEDILDGDQLDAYIKQNASFRNSLNHLSGKIKYALFRSSTKPKEVLLGKENWLYYSSKGDQLIDSYAHTDLWSAKELKNKVDSWEWRKEELSKKAVSYHVAIWPNKPTIYPEHLPDKMKKLQQDTLSKTDQIINYCNSTTSSVLPVDVRQLLMDRKQSEQVYHQQDSHWNALGAFYAYQALMKELGETPYELEDFELTWERNSEAGDLLGLLSMCNDTNRFEPVPSLRFKKNIIAKKIKSEDGPSYHSNPDAFSSKTLLVFRDSYFSALIPYVTLHYKVSYFPWSYYKPELIEQLNPDIILSANVERRL